MACDVYRAARSGRTTITTHGHPATTTIGGDTATAPGGAMDQSGFQLQKLGNFTNVKFIMYMSEFEAYTACIELNLS